MEQLFNILEQYYVYINLALIVLVLVLIIILVSAMVSMGKLKKKYRKLTRGTNNKNLEEILTQSIDKIERIQETSEKAFEMSEETYKKLEGCIQKTAIKRYRAFEDVGSDLSYSIAFLDGNNDGVILTSIYSRTESVTYAKPINNGISRYELSDEEKAVLYQASKIEDVKVKNK